MLDRCASSTYAPKNKDQFNFPEPRVLPGQGAVLPSASGGNATPRSHLVNEFHQIQFVNYYMSVTFFVILKSVKKY
jgi:hypothetical protein